MSFYGGRMQGYGQFSRGLGRYGALPSFEIPTGHAMVRGIVDGFLAQVPPASPGGLNNRQLIAKARELQAQYADLVKLPDGAPIAGIAKGLEESMSAAWADITAFANELTTLLLHDPIKLELPAIGPRPGQEFDGTKTAYYLNMRGEPNRMPKGGGLWTPSYTPQMEDWDTKFAAIQAKSVENNSKIAAVTARLNNSLGTSLGSKLVDYVGGVSIAAERVRNLKNAVVEQQTAVARQDAASANLAAKKVAVETKAVAKQLAKLEGPSPVLIGIGVLVVGAIGYALTRKKSASVAGYRRRRR